MRQLILLLLVIILASSCMILKGTEEDKEYVLRTDNSVVFITANVDADRTTTQDQKQRQENDARLKDMFKMLPAPVQEIIKSMIPEGNGILDVVPEEEIIEEPQPIIEEIGTYSCKEYIRSSDAKGACRTSVDFNKESGPVRFAFNNSCGEFTIPNPSVDFLENGKEGFAYLQWEKGSPVVFSEAGCTPSEVTAYRS